MPRIEGFFGRDITTSTGVDPQTLLGVSVVRRTSVVFENQNNVAVTSGGVAEFEIANPVVALQGSGTADAPYLQLYLNTTGAANITVSYNLRDIDSTTDNAVQPVALQFRVGSTGNFTNVPAGFVPDATTGPSEATLVTPVSAVLPAAANNQALVQVRVMTTNAVGNDEWVGVDDISVAAGPDPEPTPTPTPEPTPTPTPSPTPTPTPIETAALTISQLYGGGGNAGATLKNDFIELHNPTGADVVLDGWSVQYTSAAGTSWTPTPLSGTIAAGGYYLIQEGAGAGGTLPLPDPDASGNIAMSATSGKVALVVSTTALTGGCPTSSAMVDFVGYGLAATCSETAPTGNLSNTTAALRNGNGAVDTNSNAADFTIGAPNPRAAHDSSPKVIGSFPTAGAPNAPAYSNITLDFNEPVNVTGSWYSIQCTVSGTHTAIVSGGPTSFTLDPHVRFAGGESCTVTVNAADVTDVDMDDPPDAMLANFVLNFTVSTDLVCGDPSTLISAVQGTGLASPVNGSTVEVEGVVVGSFLGADKLRGFHLQEEEIDWDGNASSSEGIFVFEPNGGSEVEVGDIVRVRGRVAEFVTTEVTLTELDNVTNVEPCGNGGSVSSTDVDLPFPDPDFPERYEGMLVSIDQELTVTETFTLGRFGEVLLSSGGRLMNPTNVVEPGHRRSRSRRRTTFDRSSSTTATVARTSTRPSTRPAASARRTRSASAIRLTAERSSSSSASASTGSSRRRRSPTSIRPTRGRRPPRTSVATSASRASTSSTTSTATASAVASRPPVARRHRSNSSASAPRPSARSSPSTPTSLASTSSRTTTGRTPRSSTSSTA